MAEKSYLGFKAAPSVDWGKLTSEFSQGLMDISGRKAAQNIYFDQVTQNNIEMVKANDEFADQTLSDFVMGGATQMVDNLYEKNRLVKAGKLNHNEFRMFNNRGNTSFKAVSDAAKSIDANIKAMQERQQPDENGIPQGSVIEEKLMEYQSGMMNLKNRTLYQDPNTGQFSYGKLNEVTGEVEDLQDTEALLKPVNQRDNYFDAFGFVQKRSSKLGEFKIAEVKNKVVGKNNDGNDITRKVYVTETGEALNPLLDKAIAGTQQYITDDARLSFQTLNQIDSRYELYIGEDDKNSHIDQKVGIENKTRFQEGRPSMSEEEENQFRLYEEGFLVPLVENSARERTPVLNAQQNEVLLQGIDDMYKSNLDYSMVEERPSTKGKGKGKKTPSDKTPKEVSYDLYETLYNAIKEGDSETLNIRKTPEAKDLRFEVRGDGLIDVYDMSLNAVGDPNNKLVFERKSLTDLVPYFYGKSGATGGTKPEATYNAERDAFYKANPGKEEIAMMEEQTEEMPADQMASNQGGNFLQRLAKGILGRGNNQNIS
jgi:hypothetical protein